MNLISSFFLNATFFCQKTYLRQNSEKLAAFAEDVVLPINQRSGQHASVPEVVLLRDVETQDSYKTMVLETPMPRHPKQFPFFIIGISIIQVHTHDQKFRLEINNVLSYFIFVQVAIWRNVNDYDMLCVFGLDPQRRHEVWRFITVMFVHIG